MWWSRPKNTLRGLIWTDGSVVSYQRRGGDAVLVFRDYADSSLEIEFKAVDELLVSEKLCVYEVSGGTTKRDGRRWRLLLEDDDGESLLDIAYDDAQILRS